MITFERIFNAGSRRLFKYLNLSYFPIYIRKHIVYVRKLNQVDRKVISYVFNDLYHRPYGRLDKLKPIILDLGTNIGCTILDFKDEYPFSQIIGCEMDRDNYKLAIKNCYKCTNVEILNKAVWFEDGIVSYSKSTDTDAYTINNNINLNTFSDSIVSISSISINSLVKIYSLEHIDYVKMDIEGAELEVLSINNEWLNLVKEIKIEYHNGEEDAEKIKEILNSKGFTVLKDSHHWSTLIAYKD